MRTIDARSKTGGPCKMIHASFTPSEICTLRESLSAETVMMRKNVASADAALDEVPQMICYEDTIGARRYLAELEALLSWAKSAAAKGGA